MKVAKRGTIPPFIVMDVMRAVFEREARGESIIHMEVGQPATSAPPAVIEAAKRALDEDRLGYTDAIGIKPLRERISAYYQDKHQVSVDPDHVAVTMGSSGGFVLAFLAAFEAGDRVALAAPGYPAYRNTLSALGIEVVEIPVGPETNFQPTPDLVAGIEGKLDGLIVASPSNPTGTMVTAAELKALCEYCDANDIRLVSDEIYHGITYEGPAASAREFSNTVILVNSFSKYYSMTGWRIGWLVLPEDLLRSVECLAQNLFISAPTHSQYAAIAAFDATDVLEGYLQVYAENRALLLEALPKAGFDQLASADGAFYIYADVGHLTNDSDAFCKAMLAEAGVAATPGIDFDPERGHRFLRFSFARSTGDMTEAARRLAAWRS